MHRPCIAPASPLHRPVHLRAGIPVHRPRGLTPATSGLPPCDCQHRRCRGDPPASPLHRPCIAPASPHASPLHRPTCISPCICAMHGTMLGRESSASGRCTGRCIPMHRPCIAVRASPLRRASPRASPLRDGIPIARARGRRRRRHAPRAVGGRRQRSHDSAGNHAPTPWRVIPLTASE
jgi:hypothetical protein